MLVQNIITLLVQDVEVEPLNPHNFWSASEDGTVRQFDHRQRWVHNNIVKGLVVRHIPAVVNVRCFERALLQENGFMHCVWAVRQIA